MSISCITIANLPVYDQIGIVSTWIIIICRILQGISSLGEIVGTELFLTEMTKPPIQYPVVALVSVCTIIGGMAALGIPSFSTSFGISWRMAFWAGALIAAVGVMARTMLKETPKLLRQRSVVDNSIEPTKFNMTTMLAYFLIQCGWPICFYFAYIHCSGILKNSFGYSSEAVIHHNFIVPLWEKNPALAVRRFNINFKYLIKKR